MKLQQQITSCDCPKNHEKRKEKQQKYLKQYTSALHTGDIQEMVTDFDLRSYLIRTNITMKPTWGTSSVVEFNQKMREQQNILLKIRLTLSICYFMIFLKRNSFLISFLIQTCWRNKKSLLVVGLWVRSRIFLHR